MDEVYDQFVRRLVQAAASLKIGDPADPGTRLGPVITAEARERILEHINQGVGEAHLAYPPAEMGSIPVLPIAAAGPAPSPATEPPVVVTAAGTVASAAVAAPPVGAAGETEADASPSSSEAEEATAPAASEKMAAAVDADPAAVEAGPAPASSSELGYFLLPHVFIDVEPEAVIAQEEIFGPVLSVLKVGRFSDALELALRVRYGLTGGLYSRNPAHIRAAYNDFRVGNLYINRPITGAMVGRQPFGGSRMSGVGSKAGGPDYLLQFMEPRTITENTLRRGFAPAEDDRL
jgi:acyl-CoA reductase-like NAD-dependent aldehyde dehydrogenase